MVIEDNARLRTAGCSMAEAALRVCRDYDGTHRLLLAVSDWALAVANEGGRAKTPNDRTERRGRPNASTMATDVARPRSVQ